MLMTTIPVQGQPQRAEARLAQQPITPRPRYEGLFLEPFGTGEVECLDDADSPQEQLPSAVGTRSRR